MSQGAGVHATRTDAAPPAPAPDGAEDLPPIRSMASTPWPAGSFTELTERRRSTRSFSSKALSVDDVISVVIPAFRTPSGRPACAIPGSTPSIDPTLLIANVTGPGGTALREGAYRISIEDGHLVCVHELPFEPLVHCVDASDVSAPAAVLLLTLDLRKRRHYSNAYELGLLEAGQIVQNVSLSAAGRGVGACILGSVSDGPFWTATSKRDCRPLVAVALGHPA